MVFVLFCFSLIICLQAPFLNLKSRSRDSDLVTILASKPEKGIFLTKGKSSKEDKENSYCYFILLSSQLAPKPETVMGMCNMRVISFLARGLGSVAFGSRETLSREQMG